jgi:NADH dehydrogenase (ubiquinone) 1 alpha subcomplex subunit 9
MRLYIPSPYCFTFSGSVGVQMVVPFRGEPYNIKHLKVMGDIGQLVPKIWDLRDPDTIYEAVKHSNLVINLVSQKHDSRHFKMESVNIDGARLIAKISREAGVERFVHVSTAGYNKHSISEWIRSKSLGEDAVREIFPAATIVRPTSMFGIEDTLLTRPAELIRYAPIFPMYKPDRRIQPVWVDDVARGILEISANDRTSGKVYELGGPNIWAQREFYEYLFEILYNKPYVLENPDLLVEAYAKIAYHIHRNPRFTPELLDQMAYDNVVSPKSLGFEDLGIPQDELTTIRRYALNVVRMYRRVHRYDSNMQDSWIHPTAYKGHSTHQMPNDLNRIKSQ